MAPENNSTDRELELSGDEGVEGIRGADRTCLLVLGMHRSGTSALTRVLNLMGAELPENTMGAAEGNETGHWEPVRLYEYNERFLSELGTSWSDWRPLDLTRLSLAQRNGIQADFREIVESEYHDAPLFVVKEPRVCRFAGFFMKALTDAGQTVAPVLIVRNPLEVVDSLKSRTVGWPEDYTEADASLAWLMHVLKAEKASRGFSRAIVSYDDVMSDWRGVRKTIEDQAGIAFPRTVEDAAPLIEGFLTSDLRHHARNANEVALDPRLRGWVSDTYEAMLSLMANPDSQSALATLDRVYGETRRVLPILETLLSSARQTAENIRQAQSSATDELASRDEELRSVRGKLAEFENAHSAKESELDYFKRRSEALEKLVAERDAELNSSRDSAEDINVFKKAASKTSHELELREEELRLLREKVAELEKKQSEEISNSERLKERSGSLEKVLAERDAELASSRKILEQAEIRLQAQTAAMGMMERKRNQATEGSTTLVGDLVRVRNQLAEAEKQVDRFEVTRAQLAAVEQLAEEKDNEIERLRSQVQRVTTDMQAQLAAQEAFQSELRKNIREKQDTVEELRSRLLKTHSDIEKEEREKADLDQKLRQNVLLLEEAENRRNRLEDELNTSRQMLGAEASDNRDLPLIIEVRNAENQNLKQDLDTHKSELQETKSRVVVFEKVVHERSQALDDRVKAAEGLRERVTFLRSRLEKNEQALEKARTMHRQLETQTARHEAAAARLAAELETTHQNYRSSTSWRITRPLRLIKSAPMAALRALRLVPGAVEVGGGLLPATQKTIRIIRQEGLDGVRKRLAYVGNTEALDTLRGTAVIAEAADNASPETKSMVFEPSEQPEISIIIPVYNQLNYTLKCLRSLSAIDRTYSFEIIVMDDGSSDQTEELVGQIPNIVYVRNEQNLGFLRNCNKGASLAKGRFIVFLNNDTELDANRLTELRQTFDQQENVGLVGSKLVYPTGQLQEAGGIIWQDGSAWNWGRMQDPAHPAYNYLRDADYVSGASIMIERDLFERLNFFDERYENAYYEDSDLAMAVRAAGLRVVYQPRSIVIHYEGISSGTDENSGIKRYQRLNGERFFDKWSERLTNNLPNATTPFIACDRTPESHVLIIDACTPTPDQDAGSEHMYNIIKILISQGYRVHFIPQSNFAHFGHYSDALQAMGVECVYAPFYRSVDDYLKERGDMFSHVILTRYNVAAETIKAVKTHCPAAKRIFYTVDLHFLRESREAELQDDDAKRQLAIETEKAETGLMEQVDTTIVLSEVEKQILEDKGVANLAILPLIQEQLVASETSYDHRNGALFIGGYQHTPNIDAVDWLASEIWPCVRKICAERGIPPIMLNVYGSKMPERFHEHTADDFQLRGFADDLAEIFNDVRLSVAPLRFGAGLKGKLATSFGHGVPVVGTQIAYEGVEHPEFEPANLAVSDVEGVARAIVDTHEDPELWEKLRAASHDYVQATYSVDVIQERLENIFRR